MPQLSLYIDQSTLQQVEKAAKSARMSVSRWVRSRLHSSFEHSWPDTYFDLFGSIRDTSFDIPDSPVSETDTPRESL